MAETFLGPVIEKLIDLLAGEASLLKGVHKELKSLIRELEIIEPFLKDAEAKSERREFGEATNVWLRQIREEADRIEDVVDDYLYHFGHQRTGFIGSLSKAGRFIKSPKKRHKMALEIQDIQESLRKTKEMGQNFGLRPFEQVGSSTTRNEVMDPRIHLFYDEDELVGIDSVSKELVRRLIEGESRRLVISLVGEGGIGKTTLAKKVYNDVYVKARFDSCVWITVSQSYTIKRILEIMKSKICPTTETVKPREDGAIIDWIDEMRNDLRGYLQTKRYLIVFDDVWQTELWGDTKHALPSNMNGSRIIITTRSSAVADSFKETACDDVWQTELRTWLPAQAWELFCKKAFYSDQFGGQCPPELEELSSEILIKCQGLPLVIAAVAGLLSEKEKTPLEWQRVLDNLNYEFRENPQLSNVSKILSLSYQDLPYHLKPCFLYFGIFPEDYFVWDERLFSSWIAEGFISPKSGMTLEQVAKEYLNELISRKLVTIEIGNDGYQMCRVHDLIHVTILSKIETLCFAQTFNENKSRSKGKNSRRLSIHESTEGVLEAAGNSRIRSIFLFHVSGLNNSFVVRLFENFKHLKLVDFENAPLDKLPDEIGDLFHCKALNLSGTKIKKLPKSIGKLHNLQKLYVYNTLVRELPVEINKLINLRSLLAFFRDDYKNGSMCSDTSVKVHEGIGRLMELQQLHMVKAYPGGGTSFVKELGKLTKLKVLGISNLTTEIAKPLGAAIEKMKPLEWLTLHFINEDEIFYSEFIPSPPPPLLRSLDLSCRLQRTPDWISKLRNLHRLVLRSSRLMDEPLTHLKGLPNLASLWLDKAYEGEELRFEEGGFEKLKLLGLESLEGLKVLKIESGALPLLKKLQIGPFPMMKEMPSGIEHLMSLESLECIGMAEEIVSSLQQHGGSDYWKIHHIPFVQFS